MVLADLLLGWLLYRIFGGAKPAPVAAPPTTAPAPGKKRAVEVWQVKRNLQTMIVGMVGQDVPGSAMAATLTSLEQSFPSGWEACRNVSAQEIATAKALLPRWRK